MQEQPNRGPQKEGPLVVSLEEVSSLYEDSKKAKADADYWRKRYWGFRKDLKYYLLFVVGIQFAVIYAVDAWLLN